MRHEPDDPERRTKVRDETLDRLLDKADEAMDNLASALHDLRAKVQTHEHS